MTRSEVIKAIEEAIFGWSGWEWAHDPSTCSCGDEPDPVVTEGPGDVVDWAEWQRERIAELKADGHSEECAIDMATDERWYGKRVQADARDAERDARSAIGLIEIDNWKAALRDIKSAVSTERSYGDAPCYGPLVDMVEELAHEASRGLALEGLQITMGATAVIVDDGADIWAVSRDDWDACADEWDLVLDMSDAAREEDSPAADAYQYLCDRCPAPLSINGRTVDDEQRRALAAAIIADNLMDRDSVNRRWGLAPSEGPE